MIDPVECFAGVAGLLVPALCVHPWNHTNAAIQTAELTIAENLKTLPVTM